MNMSLWNNDGKLVTECHLMCVYIINRGQSGKRERKGENENGENVFNII
jgi:hypothetical protein